MVAGIAVGFTLPYLVKPQTFRDMVKTKLKQSVSRSVVIIAISFSALYFPRFIESDIVKRVTETVDFEKIALYNHEVNPEQMEVIRRATDTDE